ncbi:YlmH/Sll1252 family protein [Oceanivirga miroungae]|uniref:RNA-binding S4 domain-containing protein n=1 Tax=Oceanivirga miroungae TaxID=1130046 RepID=A0A6I8MBD4_9FUSO|nr:YlmH/Sll1252 family protein [Oceanivirga miroungae]VWL85556.1 RNA-binding S4 domain-containing protein [Oceanivirga miroungae]
MLSDRVKELLNDTINYSYINYTDFLTPNEYKKLGEKYKEIKIFKKGRLRKMLAFVPEYQEDLVAFPISLVKIEVSNKFKELSNKDFLGSIMSLNIDRKYIGDIFVEDNIAYVYVSNKVLDIVLNLDKVSKNTAYISVIEEELELDFKYEIKEYTVSSIRLDSIVAKITNLSREKTKEYILLGGVSLDYEEVLDYSKEVKENSIISIKKYGRYIYESVIKQSKKGKFVIRVKQFI